jgi:hypothetical protein
MPSRQTSPESRVRTTPWRFALFIFAVSFIVWLGAGSVRALIGNDILATSATTVRFDETLDPRAEREAFRLIAVASIVVLISYVVTILSSIVFLATSPFKFKHHGWLLMSAILLYAFVPIEVYVLHIDWKMIYNEFYTTADNAIFRELFIARIKALAGTPVIAQLCYYTIIALAVFQPFTKHQLHEA